MQGRFVNGAVAGIKGVVCGSILVLASLVFLRSLSPHQPAQSRTGAQPLAPPRVSIVKVPGQTRIYYYVVRTEQQAKDIMDASMSGNDYYGAGYPAVPPVVVVARTQEVFDSLEDLLMKTQIAGGPQFTIIDMRTQ